MAELPDDWRGMYVQRGDDGAIVIAYGNPQPNLELEPVAENDPELVAFLAPRERPIKVPYGHFRLRWTAAELSSLFDARKLYWQIDDFISLAAAQGHVNLSGDTAADAKALFVSLGVLTEERADVIFAAD